MLAHFYNIANSANQLKTKSHICNLPETGFFLKLDSVLGSWLTIYAERNRTDIMIGFGRGQKRKMCNRFGSDPLEYCTAYMTRDRLPLIRILHESCEEAETDEITWNDLEMDNVFLRINNTECFAGERRKLSEVLVTQEAYLHDEQNRIEGSIDLCRKMLQEGADLNSDLDRYLNYVKDEEVKGRKFPDVMESLDVIADNSHMEKFIGFSGQFWLKSRPGLYRISAVIVFLILVVFPVVAVIDHGYRFMQGTESILRLIVWLFMLVIFWSAFAKLRRK